MNLILLFQSLGENVDYVVEQQRLIVGLSLLCIAAIGVMFYLAHKRHPDEEVGLVVQRSWFKGKSAIVIVMVFFICLFEAGTAAMISTSNESTTSTMARFGMHLVIGFMSMFCVIIATFFVYEGLKENKTIKAKLAAIKDKSLMDVKPRRTLSHWLMIPMIMVLYFMSLWFGYINIELIAKSAGDYTRFHEYVSGAFWVWEYMDNNTALSISVGYAHMGILLIDVIVIFVLIRTNEGVLSTPDGKTIDEKINDKGKKENDKKQTPEGAISFLLKRLNYSGDELQRTEKILLNALAQREKANKTEAATMVSKLNALYHKYKEFDKDGGEWSKLPKGAARTEHKKEASKEIRDFFKGRPKDGGFGTPIAEKDSDSKK